MGKALKYYNSDGISSTFGPVTIDSGLGPDEFCVITPDADAIDDEVGCDGEVAISRNNNGLYTVEFTLMSTSSKNDELSVIYNFGLSAPAMAGGIHVLRIQDINGTSLHMAEKAWIKAAPPKSYKKKPSEMKWVLRCASMTGFWGGNISAG